MSDTRTDRPAVGRHYRGELGARRFGWQSSGGEFEARQLHVVALSPADP